MTKAQIRLIERQAIKRYKDKLKEKIFVFLGGMTMLTTVVCGVIYNLV